MNRTKSEQGNSNVNDATKQRNQQINELMTQINNLTRTFGNDKLTAETNFGLGKTQALNESQLMKYQADKDIGMFNTSEMNKFNEQYNSAINSRFLQDDQQTWQSGENVLDRNQQMAIAQLNAATQIKASQISAGAQIYAANLASKDRSAAQAFVEKQWEAERLDSKNAAANDAKISYITSRPGFDPYAQKGIF